MSDVRYRDDEPLVSEPEYVLVVRCLLQAIEDATRYPSRTNDRDYVNKLRRERLWAMNWLFDTSPAPWSARWCADLIGVDLEHIRRDVHERPYDLYRSLRYRPAKAA